jgi:hypothetical protein
MRGAIIVPHTLFRTVTMRIAPSGFRLRLADPSRRLAALPRVTLENLQ